MRLTPDQYPAVRHLLNDDNAHWPLLQSVLQGDLGGRVYVDDPRHIRSAFILSRMDWAYFLGPEDNPGFHREILAVLREKNEGNIIWFGASDSWKERAAALFPQIQEFPRYAFRWNRQPHAIPDDTGAVRILPIDQSSLDSILQKYYPNGSFWDDPNRFLQKGFGFYIREEHEIAGVILSAGVTDAGAEIDIHTDEQFRRKGYAEALSRAFIRACHEKKLLPKWDCYYQNEASLALARKLGFVVKHQYPLIFITR